jgi:ABC-type Co2+ transport system permease subunit
VFAITQIPLAVAEGLLTVIVMNALSQKTDVLNELGLIQSRPS